MADPVMVADGTIYDRASIEGGWVPPCLPVCRLLAARRLPAGHLCKRCRRFSRVSDPDAALTFAPPSSPLALAAAGWIQRCQAGRQAPVYPLTNLLLRDLELRPVRPLRSHIARLRAAWLLPWGPDQPPATKPARRLHARRRLAAAQHWRNGA